MLARWLREPRTLARMGAWVAVGVVIVIGAVVGARYALWTPTTAERQVTLIAALPTFGSEVLDPSLDGQMGQRYYGHMFDHLLGADSDGRLSSSFGVVEDWSSNPDASIYTLRLKEGVRWHDGVQMTSEDVNFSMARYSRTAVACARCGSVYESVREIRSLDEHQTVVELRVPDMTFISRLGPEQEDVPVLPVRYFESTGEASFAETPIGSGPWRFAKRGLGEFIEYDTDLDYWNIERVPGVQRLRLVQVPDRESRLALLRAGNAHMATVEPDDLASLKAEGFAVQGPKYVVETTLRFFMSYDPAFLTSNMEFRRALIHGMNLPSIFESIYPTEAATLASGSSMFSPMTEGYDPELPPYPYDPELARELLQESGYKGETTYLLSIPVYDLAEIPILNEMIAEDWRKLGVNVSIVPTAYGPVKARYGVRPQKFDDLFPAAIFHGGHVNRPGGIMNGIHRYMTGSDDGLLTYHAPEEGERIFADLMAMAEGQAREQWLRELNRVLYQEYWAAPMVWRHEVWGISPNVSNWQPANGTSFDLRFETVRPEN